jgi:hypothetical protein
MQGPEFFFYKKRLLIIFYKNRGLSEQVGSGGDRDPLSSSLLPPIFLHMVNSSSLAPAHACPAQTSPKNFKHP